MSIYSSKYPQEYYVYAYIRDKSSSNGAAGTPYYIGKGSGKRAWNKAHNVRLPPDSWRIVILESNLTEIGALALERRLIRFWGRLDIGTGCLYNKTDGGEGTSGYRHTDVTKQRIGDTSRGKVIPDEVKAKTRATKLGKPLPHGTGVKIGNKLRGRHWFNNGIVQEYLFECPEGWARGKLTKRKKNPNRPMKPRPPNSAESNLKRSETLQGKPKTDSHANNISKARKGMKFSQTHLDNLKKARAARAAREALLKMDQQDQN